MKIGSDIIRIKGDFCKIFLIVFAETYREVSFLGKFETLFDQISRISELSDRAPLQLRSDVFISLYEALKQDNEQNIQLDNIAKGFLDRTSLKAFIDQKKPASNIERSLLFVYFLETNSDEPITSELIAGCYKICNMKEPGNISQNLRDACSPRYGYLKMAHDTYTTTEKGKAFCNS